MFNPIVIKTSYKRIKECNGSFDRASKEAWYVNPYRASQCTHAIITLKGSKDVKAVYKIEKWEHGWENRYVFEGYRDLNMEKQLLGKELNAKLFTRGRRNPIAYLSANELLAS